MSDESAVENHARDAHTEAFMAAHAARDGVTLNEDVKADLRAAIHHLKSVLDGTAFDAAGAYSAAHEREDTA